MNKNETVSAQDVLKTLDEIDAQKPPQSANRADTLNRVQNAIEDGRVEPKMLPVPEDKRFIEDTPIAKKRFWVQALEDKKRLATGNKQLYNTQRDENGRLYESVIDDVEENYDPEQAPGEPAEHEGDERKRAVELSSAEKSVPIDNGIAELIQTLDELGYHTAVSCSGLVDDHPEGHYIQNEGDPVTSQVPETGMGQNGYLGFVVSEDQQDRRAVIKEAARRAGLGVDQPRKKGRVLGMMYSLSVNTAVAQNGAVREQIKRSVEQEVLEQNQDVFKRAQKNAELDRKMDEAFDDIARRLEADLKTGELSDLSENRQAKVGRYVWTEIVNSVVDDYSRLNEMHKAGQAYQQIGKTISQKTRNRWQEQADELLNQEQINARWKRFGELVEELHHDYRP